MTAHGPEIELVAGELRGVLNDLSAVPDWTPGRLLRNELMGALHVMRSTLLFVARDLDDRDAGERLAATPYIARPMVDQGMAQAANAGLDCAGFE